MYGLLVLVVFKFSILFNFDGSLRIFLLFNEIVEILLLMLCRLYSFEFWDFWLGWIFLRLFLELLLSILIGFLCYLKGICRNIWEIWFWFVLVGFIIKSGFLIFLMRLFIGISWKVFFWIGCGWMRKIILSVIMGCVIVVVVNVVGLFGLGGWSCLRVVRMFIILSGYVLCEKLLMI